MILLLNLLKYVVRDFLRIRNETRRPLGFAWNVSLSHGRFVTLVRGGGNHSSSTLKKSRERGPIQMIINKNHVTCLNFKCLNLFQMSSQF